MRAVRETITTRNQPTLRLLACGCSECVLQRVYRKPWMRLIPGSALYRCGSCGDNVLRRRHARSRVYVSRPAR